jgi:acyl carrier protein
MTVKIQNVVSCAIDRVNELLPAGQTLAKERTTALLGRGGRLDSMGFVNLIAALEEELEKQLAISATLADELMNGHDVSTVGDLYELLIRVVTIRRSADDITTT